MMRSIKKVIMQRDNMTESEAEMLIEEARIQLAEYLEEGNLSEAENICEDFFGLEPDYIDELF